MARYRIVSIARYQIIDIDIQTKCKCDIIDALGPHSAIDAHVRTMGWNNYADFKNGASHHSGVRGFRAEAILMPQVPMLNAA